MSLKYFEATLEDCPTSARQDVLRSVGCPKVLVHLYREAKVTLNTGGLEELLRDTEWSKAAQLPPDDLEVLIDALRGGLRHTLAYFASMLMEAAVSDFVFGDGKEQSRALLHLIHEFNQDTVRRGR